MKGCRGAVALLGSGEGMCEDRKDICGDTGWWDVFRGMCIACNGAMEIVGWSCDCM